VLEADRVVPVAGPPWAPEATRPDRHPAALCEVDLLPPATPSKIVCIGRNYREHAAELQNPVPTEPLLFLKPPSCLVGHRAPIVYPTEETRLVHHEGELALVIGRRLKRASPGEAERAIAGYTLMNDVTARDLQRKDGAFARGKGFDSFGPLGPWVDTDFMPRDQLLTTHVNGVERQRGRLDQMIFSPAELVAFISRIMTLEPGDLVSTGTPAGVGPLGPGELVEVRIADLGCLANPVIAGENTLVC
jgi:2-keto-4-pentenoate hydratase/2-oxohepta-3-ene-1,7-dioic acid hydratase in catechol pathway